MAATRIRCWLIGSESLLQECGDILLHGGHEVRGVVTASARVAAWARDRHLEILDPHSDFAAVLARRPFDHLFAITHLGILPDRILLLPARSAINFHDGPLPEYAGLHAPSWALLQREPRHGITWHVMTPTLDAGPILKQVSFAIAADESAFTLNAKCFEAALGSFAELVGELAAGTFRLQTQDLARRHVYERHRRPAAACVLDWSRPAPELEALVRALDFGRYPNPLGLAKLRHGRRTLLITRARANAPGAAAPPGTVLACTGQEVRVATASGSLALEGFAELDGRALAPEQAARRFGLAPGVVLGALAADQAERLTALDGRMSRAERQWVRRLAELDPLDLPLPLTVGLDPSATEARPTGLDVALPAQLGRNFPGRPLTLLLSAAFCAYLARLTRRSTFDIGYADDELRQAAEGQDWIAAHVPLRIAVDFQGSLLPLLASFATESDEARARGPWLLDVVARHPELHALRGRADALFPVCVERRAAFAAPELARGVRWALEICDAGAPGPGACRLVYDAARLSAVHAASIRAGFAALLDSLATSPTLALAAHTMASSAELRRQGAEWNSTAVVHRRDVCVHELFEEQVACTPTATALVSGASSLTYAELDQRAERLAQALVQRGARAGRLVGIFVDRSVELVVAVLGTLKAGAAYVPLDPTHPPQRLAALLADAELDLIVTRERLAGALPASGAQVVCVDGDLPHELPGARGERARAALPADLAYVIYTSGSTGRPKGVLVEHRNVASFFAAMDERIPHEPPGVWLALTSLSFDISVLELLWPLCRGFKVIVHPGSEHARSRTTPSARKLDFSLFYFASDEGSRSDGYRLLLEGARFADTHGFCAVWTPERHFHAFGGLFPNPAVTGAAIAAITQRVQIRAGSVVLPLHHPIRVAEDWALVDNLSNGRVALSFASGWKRDDFVLAPASHAHAKDVMLRDIEVVRRLWRGETLAFPGPDGAPVDVCTLPRPVQPELPVWITTAGNVETYVTAGRMGANVLTHLLGQSVEQLAPKIRAYRQARAQSGFDPATGVVALMLHTFVGADEERVRASVREPLERYLASALTLIQRDAWSFPAFHRPGGAAPVADDLAALAPEERAALLAEARRRYYEASGLFGTPERCREQVARLRAIEVDELACLIDFGLPADEVLASLPLLDLVRSQAQELSAQHDAPPGPSLAAQLAGEGVTHLQCTPSMARVLCADSQTRSALRHVRHAFVGGEALATDLAREFGAALGGALTNMYGPTETTVWSATHMLTALERGVAPPSAQAGNAPPNLSAGSAQAGNVPAGSVPIGRPIANTRFHVLDEHLQPLPIGVAGELFIAGDGVARGYLRRPELDAERFLPERSVADGQARMYRTGDLVRYRADGTLEFLERLDHQVKLRGHRIEPGEIEAALLRDDVSEHAIAEALVVAREDRPGDQRLVAYLVPRGAAVEPARLRARLEAHLPEYMLPAEFVFLAQLPRSPNGKLDRRALPAPEARPAAQCVAPVGELESRLAALWRETLALERVGVEDNFFDLGGHSLLIVRLQRRMHEVTTRPVPLTDLFRFPTIRSLALHLASPVAVDTLAEAASRGRRRRTARPLRRQRAIEG